MHKPVEEDIITFTQVEIKHFMPEWIPNGKKIHKTRIFPTEQKNMIYYSRHGKHFSVHNTQFE